MELKYAQLSANPTKEEILAEINRLEKIQTNFKNVNEGLKILLNSIYGVAGYKGYKGYHIDVAASVTGQSQDIIKFVILAMNSYFMRVYPTDVELHQKLKIDISNVPAPTKEIVIYADTDSIFLHLESIYKSSKFDGDFPDFVLSLYNHRLKQLIEKRMNQYINQYSAFPLKMDNSPSFRLTLEAICHSNLWAAKKKYVKHKAWENGMKYKLLENIEIKGLESNKPSVPKFIRDNLKRLIIQILDEKAKGGNIRKMLETEVKAIRSAFDILDIHEICNTIRISNYEKYVISDKIEMVIGPNSNIETKGAMVYNYLVKNYVDKNGNMLHNPTETKEELKQYIGIVKYGLIKSGMKVNTYMVQKGYGTDVFSFIAGGSCPDFAPPIDMDAQFEKIFLAPLNNITEESLGIINLPPSAVEIPEMW